MLSAPLTNREELAEIKQQMPVYQRALARIEAVRINKTTAANPEHNTTTEQAGESNKAEIVSFKSSDGCASRRVKTALFQ
ncbi:MAG: hypothetical protein ABI644_04465 [Arenimonas sp.]